MRHHRIGMRLRSLLVAAICAVGVTVLAIARGAGVTTLPNGWQVTPSGVAVKLPGDMPLRIVEAPDGQSVLVVTGGFHDHSIAVINPATGTLLQSVLLGKAWGGLVADTEARVVYVAGGGSPPKKLSLQPDISGLVPEIKASLSVPILRLTWANGCLVPVRALGIPGLSEDDRFIAGLALDRKGDLFVANIETDTIYKIDPTSGRLLASAKVGYRPYQLAVAPSGAYVAVANWGDESVSLLAASDLSLVLRIPVGIHPTDLAFAPDGRLFVANAGSNSVSVIRGDHVTETIVTSLHPGDPVGSTPNAVALTRDGTRLYVANADNNDIAVIDVHESARSRVLGFIPTGWYPSALALTQDGRHLVVGVAKGMGSRPNFPAQLPDKGNNAMVQNPDRAHVYDYVGRVMTGYAEIIRVPGAKALERYTRQVRANSPIRDRRITREEKREAETAFDSIKHVIYVIRENRTYDQVMGDDARGDGEPELAYFGREITPNAHALALNTVLLDRYFVNGEVSEDGHNWANAAYATAYNERETASIYGNRDAPDADERLMDSPAGRLWDSAHRAGLSYFSYGEAADFKATPDAPPVFVGDRGLAGHASPNWGGFLDKSDVERAKIFIADLKAAEKTGNWPAYAVVWFPWDHTAGLAPGKPTPQAAVASNDLALGMLVEAVSHSTFWASTAIFVTEDDAQNGPDHVDDHRSVALVLSPYVRQGLVDHTHYTMTSIIRTMELILKLPPMTQYDRDATPMYRLFQPKPRTWNYTVAPERVDLNAVNPPDGPLEKASLELDLSGPDRADPEKLNAILWAAMKPDAPMPSPVRSAEATRR